MSKLILSLIGILLTTAFSPQVSALPLFARQTGMECAACHFQHFPMLTAFGRAFKSGAYSMMGAQGKVEGDNLSIPAVLNAAILSTAGYSKSNMDNMAATNSANAANGGLTNGDGGFYMPGTNGEFSLFVGGRTSDFSGALAELGMVPSVGAAGGLSSAKIPMLWEVADGTRAGIVPFTTDGQGASYGFETLNTGANAVHTMLFVGGDFAGMVAPVLSAQQYILTGAPATGAAFVVNNPSYFVNVTKYSQIGPGDFGGSSIKLGSTYLRAAYIFDLAGFDSAVGIQNWSGSSGAGDPTGTAVTMAETKGTAIDGQMQGALGNMPIGFYASYARAPAASDPAIPNAYNSGAGTRSSINFSTELGVIPEKATLAFGIRRGKSGQFIGAVFDPVTGTYSGGTAGNASDNAFLLGASYKLAQNIMLNLYYVSQSGDYWNATNTAARGSKETMINLATIF